MTNYSDEKLNEIWDKGRVIPGSAPNMWRQDEKGNKIKRSDYGEEVEHGWEVDHIVPKSKGGSDSLSNLRPLQWEANRRKGDN